MAGIKDVAERAGVSIATVSNVINQRKPVSPELAARVHQAVLDLNYVVDPVGRTLKSNRTNTIGVIVPSFSQVYFPSILQGIHEAAKKLGYMISVFETSGDIQEEQQCVEFLQRTSADGIILASYANRENISDRDYIRTLAHRKNRNKKIPVVTLENDLDPSLDAVIIDNREAGRIAVSHLLSLGHRSIAHIAAPLRFQIGKLRLEGYQDALEQAGLLGVIPLVEEGDFSPISGYHCMERLLSKRRGEFSAVFVANDEMAVGAMRAILNDGLRIPEDVAVVGLDNTFPSTLVKPSLTSVSTPKYEMGCRAMEQVARRIENPEDPKAIITLQTELVVRQSTDPSGEDRWDLISW